MTDQAGEFTEDAFLGGQLRLRQPKSGHRAGLAVARRVPGIRLVLVEIDEGLAALARGNAGSNAIAAEIVALDVMSGADAFVAAGLPPDSADVVLMNPPFNDPARHRASPQRAREIAHVATAETLEGWIHAARRTLKSGGVLTMIWRADGLAEVLAALDRGFGSLAILPVHADPGSSAIRVLIRAIKGGRAPMQLHAALIINDGPAPQEIKVREILAGKGVLPLAIP